MDLSNIAIIGSGPAGCVLGRLLSESGLKVTIFDSGMRPKLVVGESLVPAILPLLRELGLEEKIRAISQHKPGASMFFPDGLVWKLDFSENADAGDHYSFNVPRDKFDRIFQDMARDFGCRFVDRKAEVEVGSNQESVIKGEPGFSFIVDASGRNRVLSKALSIPAKTGKRKDIALFAHCSDAQLPHGGNIHLGISDLGWSWRIPLPGKVSIGIVAPADYVLPFGATDQERFDQILKKSDFLAPYLVATTKRLSSVARYNNYQLVSDKMFGADWALVGDAAGFIDPVFSGGAFLALWGAKHLARSMLNDSFENYEKEYRQHLYAWQALVDSFYDGRFFKSIRVASKLKESGKVLEGTKGLACRIVSGASITNQEEVNRFEALLNLTNQFPLSASIKVDSAEMRSN